MNNPHDGHPDEELVEVIVNTRPRKVPAGEISYERVVDIAYNSNPPSGDGVLITVSWRHGNDEGSLTPGHSTPVRGGMKFNVDHTGKS